MGVWRMLLQTCGPNRIFKMLREREGGIAECSDSGLRASGACDSCAGRYLLRGGLLHCGRQVVCSELGAGSIVLWIPFIYLHYFGGIDCPLQYHVFYWLSDGVPADADCKRHHATGIHENGTGLDTGYGIGAGGGFGDMALYSESDS